MLAHLSHGGSTCNLVPSVTIDILAVHFFDETLRPPPIRPPLFAKIDHTIPTSRSIAVHAATVNRTTETKEKEEESLNICPSERERRLKRKRQRYSRVERPKTWRKGLDQ